MSTVDSGDKKEALIEAISAWEAAENLALNQVLAGEIEAGEYEVSTSNLQKFLDAELDNIQEKGGGGRSRS